MKTIPEMEAEIEILKDANAHAWKVAKNLQADVDVMQKALKRIARAVPIDVPDCPVMALIALEKVRGNREEPVSMKPYTTDINNICITAMLMMDGVLSNRGKTTDGINELMEAWAESSGCGWLEFASELAQYAEISEQLLSERNPEDWPGVYDYEVSDPFGQWFGRFIVSEGRAPSLMEGKCRLIAMQNEFFNQMEVAHELRK